MIANMLKSELRPALALLALLTLLTGAVYPALVTVAAKALFPSQASGSLIVKEGKVLGSGRVGQGFSNPKYFWSRPSATAPAYNGAVSSGSNLGPINPALLDAIKGRAEALGAAHAGAPPREIPIDLVTASGSGLDPHISPAAAEFQVARVARARGMEEAKARDLVAEHTEGRQLGFLGEPRVNVLKLNLALDELPR